MSRITGALLLVAGVLVSFVGAGWWGNQLRADEQRVLSERASSLAGITAGLISREVDMTDAALAYLRVHPEADAEQFGRWAETVRTSGRHPGVQMFGYTEMVPAADADAALARMASGLTGLFEQMSQEAVIELMTELGDGNLDPSKSEYCIITWGAGEPSAVLSMLGALELSEMTIDICGGPIGVETYRVRDAGKPLAAPLFAPNMMLFLAPHYRGGDTPATLTGRREAFAGVMGGMVDARAMLRSATGVEDGSAWLELSRVLPDGRTQVLATSHDDRPGGRSVTIPLEADGHWLLEVVSSSAPAGVAPGVQQLVVLGIGLALSVLLFGFVETLRRSRGRALRLVDQRTRELRHLALHDPLTGLPNRALIVDRVAHLRQRSRRNNAQCAALFIDLDGFKDINDTLGHQAGDQLLKAVAERLEQALRQCDTVGRLGGDEFVVLVEGNPGATGAEVVAERVLEVMRQPFRLLDSGLDFSVTTSVGVAIVGPDDDVSASDLLRNADVALYQAKAAGRDRYVVFEPEMQAAVVDRLALGMDLREALVRQELYLDYQPIFDVQSTTVTGLEALVRWAHPERGVIAPMDFIPLAEESGFIEDLGAWVLRQACQQMSVWHEDGYELNLSVNVSVRQLERPDFLEVVRDALHDSGLPPGSLVLEITESALMADADDTASRLRDLKRLGVRVAVDDFGTGYSSLSYLRQFPVDSIKIDRSFLSDLGSSPEAATFLHSLIQLGKNLGLETLAEGIEQDAQMAYLRTEQCDAGQGFLYARPLSALAVGEFLQQANTAHVTSEL